MNQATILSGLAAILLFLGSLANATDWQWEVTEKPPRLVNPVRIDLSQTNSGKISAWGILCAGSIYKVRLRRNDDAVIFMSGPDPLQFPVHITGGRNVHVIGLQIELVTQPGCEVGRLPNRPPSEYPNANIHPRVPGEMALRLQQSHVTFVEGLYIDARGHQTDCIVIRNPDDLDGATAQMQRDVIIQNTACRGVEGMGKTDIGDGVHGDLFQNQGRDVMRRLVFENVSHRTSHEGIVLHGDQKNGLSATKTLILRRYDYSWDKRFVGDDDYERFGLAFSGDPGTNWFLENGHNDDYRDNGDYLIINGQRYGNSPSRQVLAHPEIRSGLPSEGTFAPPERTGLNYRSPHMAGTGY